MVGTLEIDSYTDLISQLDNRENSSRLLKKIFRSISEG